MIYDVDNLLVNDDINFYKLDDDISIEKLKSLINKYVVVNIKEDKGSIFIPAFVTGVKDNSIILREHDYGNPNEDFKEWENEILLDKVLGIEEYKNYNISSLELNKYVNNFVIITNKDDLQAHVFLKEYNDYEITFDIKHKTNDDIVISENTYPINYIKSIAYDESTN
ncbi:MAG: hypothetical protein ACI4U0_04905 [Candidatus Aphodocola sp.]